MNYEKRNGMIILLAAKMSYEVQYIEEAKKLYNNEEIEPIYGSY